GPCASPWLRREGLVGRSPTSSPSGTPSIFGDSVRPSYQNTFTGGIEPRAGKSNRMTDFFGNMNELAPSLLTHSTLLGAPTRNARFDAPRMWHAMSPSAPQPKS